jgi:hypothetical protein
MLPAIFLLRAFALILEKKTAIINRPVLPSGSKSSSMDQFWKLDAIPGVKLG